MPAETDTKRIVSIRTFADDVKEVRAKRGLDTDGRTAESAVPPSEIPEQEQPAPDSVSAQPEQDTDAELEQELEQKMSGDVPPAVLDEPFNIEKESERADADVVENPPFHSIYATSPEDTTYTDEESIAVPDKKTLKKETVQADAPEQHDPHLASRIDAQVADVPEQHDSVLASTGTIFDTEEASRGAGDGSIVIDRKRRRHRLIPSLFSAIMGWFSAKREALAEMHKPKHTIERSERRKDVIEEASKRSRRAPSDDHARLSDRLKDVERVETTGELQIKDERAATPSWKYVDDDAAQAQAMEDTPETLAASLDAALNETGEKEPKRGDTPEPETPTRTQRPETAPNIPDAQSDQELQQSAPYAPASESRAVPTSQPPSVVRKKEPSPPHDSGYEQYREKFGPEYSPQEDAFLEESLPPASGEPTDDAAEAPHLQRSGVPDYRMARVGQPKKREQRTQGTPLLTLAAVIIAAVILGVGTTVWFFTRGTTGETATVPAAATSNIIDADVSTGVPLGNDRITFYQTLRGSIGTQGGGVSELYPMLGDARAAPEAVFPVLALSAPGNFTRAIDEMTFGGYGGEEPYIIMRFSAFDTVFAGMLAWEQQMPEDLAPLFGPATPATTIDSRVNNRDVRVLVDPSGEDRIVYGFPDKRTILITTSRNAYSTIASEIE